MAPSVSCGAQIPPTAGNHHNGRRVATAIMVASICRSQTE